MLLKVEEWPEKPPLSVPVERIVLDTWRLTIITGIFLKWTRTWYISKRSQNLKAKIPGNDWDAVISGVLHKLKSTVKIRKKKIHLVVNKILGDVGWYQGTQYHLVFIFVETNQIWGTDDMLRIEPLLAKIRIVFLSKDKYITLVILQW